MDEALNYSGGRLPRKNIMLKIPTIYNILGLYLGSLKWFR